ncbi:Mediator of RNA polymerase II transcription subunit 5 [Penicillium oxalicum]|uniref:Mediator of RNA polymerase II transcription subunit 5 n=1 Tax=Penicillium oxalicum TaxID=69781 RepID=UPI0020B7FC4A|nr:Mediator of RNA polymerase II transcription subunit 5 [Penicillium oxalicum]KAI2785701.1 Mediator of RNA polymerase II transcription subunit 5 [Penicillium oxalicum]
MRSDMSSVDQWKTFVKRCLARRVDVEEFQDLTQLMQRRVPLKENELLDLLFETRSTVNVTWDPLLPVYVEGLCKARQVKAASALKRLLAHSTIRKGPESKCKTSTFMTDIKVIQDVMLSISTGAIPRVIPEAAELYDATAEWILAVVEWYNQTASEQNGGANTSADALSLFESLGILLAALSGTNKGLEMLSSDHYKDLRTKLGRALTAYIPLCVEVSLPLRQRLDALQKEFNLFGDQTSKQLDQSSMQSINVTSLQFEASVMDGPVINTRAGLYVYLNSMLVGRPLVDDALLVNYLTNRYEGHQEVLVVELTTAAFDVLCNGVNRNESSRTMFLFRSFLVNKLPAFFAAMIAASMVPIPMEMCITQALSRLDPNSFPSFSQMFSMQGSSILSDARQEFLFACASHRLIQESSIERLLGENPMQTVPVGGPYQKDDLVSQINNSPGRAEQLIGEIESMEGNAGAIVGAITEVMLNLCNQKETMTLKNICNSISRRPQTLDVILLFRTTKQVLQPLCALLDSWHWDEDQGENQPVYDEFGGILLLVLVFKYRYNLTPADMGISSSDSFILKLLDRGSCSQRLNELNEKQNKDLGAWIGALFIAEGISEETMSACSPQDFYMLVATLFDQNLLEPFLLPSLVVALIWLGNHIWQSEIEPEIPLKALYSLVKPSSISGEAQAIHKTVLNITARPLEEQLKDVRTRHQARQNIDKISNIKPILDALDPYLSFRRVGGCSRSELDTWAAPATGGLLGSIRGTLQSLTMWSASSDINLQPQPYTHRQLLAGINLLGTTRILNTLVEELKHQAQAGSGDFALDIVATMVCAPIPESFAVEQNVVHSVDPAKEAMPRCAILTLRDALSILHQNVPKTSEKDPLTAEIIVRLWRRVSLLSAPPSRVSNIDVSNIIQNMELGVDGQNRMDLDMTGGTVDNNGGGEHDPGNIDRMLDNAAAAAAAGMNGNVGQDLGLGTGSGGMDAIDDVLNAADMAVGNPEFLDLDMEGMF